MSFSDSIDNLVATVESHWPDILSGIGITTGVATTIYGITVTPKAMDDIVAWVIENTTEEQRVGFKTSELHQLIPWKIKIALLWRYYLPIVLGIGVSVGTSVAADVMHDRKEMAYAALATAAEARLKDFVASTKEVVGPKKYDEIEARTAQKTLDRLEDPKQNKNIYYANKKTEGFPVMDNLTGRVYYVDRQWLERMQERLNAKLIVDDVPINDIFRELHELNEDILIPVGGENLVYTIGNGKLTFVDDMWSGLYDGRPVGVLNLVHNLCIRVGRDYVKVDKYR